MKRLTLLFILGFMLLITPNVNAEEFINDITCSSTKNIFNEVWYKGYRANYSSAGQPLLIQERSSAMVSDYISIKESTDYFLSSNYDTNFNAGYIFFVDENKNFIRSETLIDTAKNYINSLKFTSPSNAEYFLIYLNFISEFEVSQYYMQIEEGSSQTDYVSYESCSTIEEPEEPDPKPVVPDSTLDSYFSIYTTKLSQISQFALENKFLLGAITIILSFGILELFIFLFNKGGYK